ncbi:hypothetical protein [Streptomyces sp. UNOB3_S3]|uniref:hypothetical protein n=1 Tax=Streptomyces sp. UNOB3_S3 TaxID=2871682 RepID=UPI0023B0D560|nr:hypothetical protein [Streptomyces sp. UNOB3_S3]MCC3775297.1 hypothetical protein [Streptomyces sp. UNOB3_S3]
MVVLRYPHTCPGRQLSPPRCPRDAPAAPYRRCHGAGGGSSGGGTGDDPYRYGDRGRRRGGGGTGGRPVCVGALKGSCPAESPGGPGAPGSPPGGAPPDGAFPGGRRYGLVSVREGRYPGEGAYGPGAYARSG